jgi:hypothetical protein
VFYFKLLIIAKRFSNLNFLAFELDSHSQFEISKFFLRTSFTPIPSSQEVVADKEVNFVEALDK